MALKKIVEDKIAKGEVKVRQSPAMQTFLFRHSVMSRRPFFGFYGCLVYIELIYSQDRGSLIVKVHKEIQLLIANNH